jgi:hypothetical protein
VGKGLLALPTTLNTDAVGFLVGKAQRAFAHLTDFPSPSEEGRKQPSVQFGIT